VVARPAGTTRVDTAAAKAKVLDAIGRGMKVHEAMALVGRKPETYRDWMKNDAEFKSAVADIRTIKSDVKGTGRLPVPDFPTFCREDLKQPLFPHQLRMLDVLEGREPRNLHHSMTYEPGKLRRVLINVPPDHAKSTTFTINYVTWCIFKNPDEQIAIICKDQGLAKQFLGAIKQRLVSPLYLEMQSKYGPEEGFKDTDQSWTQDQIFIRGRGMAMPDPTIQAIGIKGRIYGARLTKVICDDLVTGDNVNEFEAQHRKLMQEIETRLPPAGGLLAVLGTRMAPVDLYRYLRDQNTFNGSRYWTYFSQPAVLDAGDGPTEQWQTLWPWARWQGDPEEAHEERCCSCYAKPDDCVCDRRDINMCEPKWNGPNLADKRGGIGERLWALTFQQSNVAVDATFIAEAIDCAINRMRFPGPMTAEGMGHRERGMEGLYIVGGVDPATVGHTAMVICGFDRHTQKRYILDGFNVANCTAEMMIDTIKRFTETYGVHEWVFERNAFQRFLTQLPDLRIFLQARGVRITPHWTQNTNKFDSDFGVGAMGPLFQSCGHPQALNAGGKWLRTPDKALIELPNSKQNVWVQELVNQLIVWEPQGMTQRQKTDLVMALWFTEIAIQRLLGFGRSSVTHLNNKFASRGSMKARGSINILDHLSAVQAA
jgi:hypothetical protein